MATVTLTTDFGTRDGYVAQMKGVLLSRGPDALQLVDLSHEIAAQDVREAAFLLRHAVPRFAAGTVHLVVIDPGVGSARRALAVQLGEQYLVGPDNGVFGWLLSGGEAMVELEPARLGVAQLSSTFHGRDLFAPAAAALAAGRELASLGAPARDPVVLPWPPVEREDDLLHGCIVHVDRFGNLITNLARADVEALGPPRVASVIIAGSVIAGVRDHYAEVAPGELLSLFGSQGLLEVAVSQGSAARRIGAAVGDEVSVTAGQVAELPLDGELDLHTFRPSEVADVVEEYVRACHERGLRELRIVHGKGRGTLRRTVHDVLGRLPVVERYQLAPPERGGWGATLVDLRDPS